MVRRKEHDVCQSNPPKTTQPVCLSVLLSVCLLRGLGRLQKNSQDSLQDDSFVSSAGPDPFSDTALFSGSDSETQPHPTPCWDQEPPLQCTPPSSLLPDDDPEELPSALDSASSGDGLHPDMEQEEEEACPGGVGPHGAGEETLPPTAGALSRKLSSDSLLVSQSLVPLMLPLPRWVFATFLSGSNSLYLHWMIFKTDNAYIQY